MIGLKRCNLTDRNIYITIPYICLNNRFKHEVNRIVIQRADKQSG